eukprot:1712632-Amphidinium_carterae.1
MILLAMMQGEKPRYEIRFTNNWSSDGGLNDPDITILEYRMLQGHFSRITVHGEAQGTDPDKISTVVRLVAKTPGDTEPRMRYGYQYGYHATAIALTGLNSIVMQGLVPSGDASGDTSIRDAVHLCPLHSTHDDAIGIWALDRAKRRWQLVGR